MKTIFIFAAGSFVPGILNQIITHPQIIDVALGCLLGVLFGLLCACVFVGPTPKPKVLTQKVNKTVHKPRRIIEQPAAKGWTFTPMNYPQGAMA